MSKYVNADIIVDRVCEGISCNECSFGTNEDGMSECVLDKRIAELPTADVAPVVHGKWSKENIVLTSYPPQYRWYCSNCGKAIQGFDDSVLTSFCPNCGADMRGEENE